MTFPVVCAMNVITTKTTWLSSAMVAISLSIKVLFLCYIFTSSLSLSLSLSLSYTHIKQQKINFILLVL
jgi:hypothetical protein